MTRPMTRLLALLVLLAACDPPDHGPRFRAAGATTPRDGGRLRFAILAGVQSLDPAFATDEMSYYPLHALFDTLVDYAPGSLTLIPRLADHWTISPDGLHYTFWLRPNLAFHDGAPLTAADAKRGLERTLKAKGAPFVTYLLDIEGAQAVLDHPATTCNGITAAGNRLDIQLTRRNPGFLAILTMPFTTPQRSEADNARLRSEPDANGPYELASWDEGNELVLRRNPHYDDRSRGHLDEIAMRENVPRDTQFQMFERGELDTVDKLAAPDYLYVIGEPAWQPYLHRTNVPNTNGSRINVTAPILSDRRVRQALNYALDKSHSARLLNGTTTPSHGMLPPGMLGRDPELAPYPHDVAKARALLVLAGYPTGIDLDYVTAQDEETEKLTQSLQADLAEAGIRLAVHTVSFQALNAAIAQPDGPPLSYGNWIADFPDPINFLDTKFHSSSIPTQTNDTFYANPAFDRLLDAARDEIDPDRRAALYRQAERILYDDAPWIWDYHRVATEVTQPYVRGPVTHPIWIRDFTAAWLDLGAEGQPVARGAEP